MIEENVEVQPKGAQWVLTPKGRPLGVRSFISDDFFTENGERFQIRHARSAGTAIAQSQTDSSIIAAPADSGTYYLILAIFLMCDAATEVTLGSKIGSDGTVVKGGPYPCAANGGFERWFKPHGYFRCDPGAALVMTTGAGGATTYEFDFVELPINIDFPE
jgi:hypothetical protein